tara:strand:+ start:142 stop:666 length:525 start_codon:yes stop_codon:yes gene_type:complete
MSTAFTHKKRHSKTISFIKKHIDKNDLILDLGSNNDLSKKISLNGYNIKNTKGENLDDNYLKYCNKKYDCITAFEIFEHMLSPYNILKNINSDKLIASVPLKLWFASAYWNEKDDFDKHYHEFEIKQFNFLLQKTKWKIMDYQLWTSPDPFKIGIRPILRYFYNRYYIVYCKKN